MFKCFTKYKFATFRNTVSLIGGGCIIKQLHSMHKASKNTEHEPSSIHSYDKTLLLRALFGRKRSRFFGTLMGIPISPRFRPLVNKLFVKAMKIDISELPQELESYETLGDIFARTLKEGCRFIEEKDNPHTMVVPCDGQITTLGEFHITQNCVNQMKLKRATQPLVGPIKGATFRVDEFLGFNLSTCDLIKPSSFNNTLHTTQESQFANDKQNVLKQKRFAYAIIYLAPHNYHHFHSPCEFGVITRRHMYGTVFPVFKGLARRLNNLFSLNERVVYSGVWNYGQLHFAAVAAYNVANISLKCEPKFQTNIRSAESYPQKRIVDIRSYQDTCQKDALISPTLKKTFVSNVVKAHWFQKGESLGAFRLGSTVVLLFEIPPHFQWKVREGDYVQMGQVMARVEPLS